MTKNSRGRTDGWYKPTVRMFKNVRTYLIDRDAIREDLAPSYFLESLIYNAPDSAFGTSFQDTVVAVFNWLWEAKIAALVCQNGEISLFGTTPEQWDALKARQFLEALKELWENW